MSTLRVNSVPTGIPITIDGAPYTTPVIFQPIGTNLAPINDGQWHSDLNWNTCPTDNIFAETAFTHNGAPTWRIEQGASLGADHDWGVLPVRPTDHIIMLCWVYATKNTEAMLGLDYYGQKAGTWAWINDAAHPQNAGLSGSRAPMYLQVGVRDQWIKLIWDFIIPQTFLVQWVQTGFPPEHRFELGESATPTNICPWLFNGDHTGTATNTGTTYFSDFQFYINP